MDETNAKFENKTDGYTLINGEEFINIGLQVNIQADESDEQDETKPKPEIVITTVNNSKTQRRSFQENQNMRSLKAIDSQEDINKLSVNKKNGSEKYQASSQADDENESEENDKVHSFFGSKGNLFALIIIESNSDDKESEDENLFFPDNHFKRFSTIAPQTSSLLDKKRIQELEDIIVTQRNFIAELQMKLGFTYEINQ